MEKPLWERVSFFKVMIGDFQTSLRIPPCFIKHLSGEILVKSVLRSRNGRRWAVMLRREGNSLFFREGWVCFVADLAIQLGELLLFVYDGGLGFDVKIYGITGCEKEDPIVAVDADQEEEGREREEVPAKTSTRLIRAPGRRRNKKLEEEILKAEKSFRPYARFASTFLKARKYTLNIPSHALRQNDVTKISKTTLRDPSGRSWPVDIKHRLDGRAVLGRGWIYFCRANHLQENDICIFELTGGIQKMDVQIRRLGLVSH